MRIGFCHFLHHFKYLTPLPLSDDALSYYTTLEMELDNYEDFDPEEMQDDTFVSGLFDMKSLLETREPILKKIFSEFNEYSISYYSEFLSYNPRDPELKKVKESIIFCVDNLKGFHEKYGCSFYGADEGGIHFEEMFRIFPEKNGIDDYEVDSIQINAQNGVLPLESFLTFNKTTINFEKREKSKKIFNELLHHLIVISEYFNKDE
jgi:hypothetical protein